MDIFQKNALRHKRHLIAINVILDEALVELLRGKHLINDAMLEEMKDETSNFGRMVKYLKQLPHVVGLGAGVFARLLLFLEECHPWLNDELRAELKAERGELPVDEYIRREAGQLVAVEYAGSSRLAEADKRQLEGLLSVRAQCYKESARRVLMETQQQLQEQTTINQNNEDRSAAILSEASQFVRLNLPRVPVLKTSKAGNSKGKASKERARRATPTNRRAVQRGRKAEPVRLPAIVQDNTPDIGVSADDEKNSAVEVPSNENSATLDPTADTTQTTKDISAIIEQLHDLTIRSLQQRDVELAKKQRVLEALNITSGPIVKLDVEMDRKTTAINDELSAALRDLEERERRAAVLRERLEAAVRARELEQQGTEKRVASLKERLAAARQRTVDLRREAVMVERKVAHVRHTTINYKQKSSIMSQTRHLGYVVDKEALLAKIPAV